MENTDDTSFRYGFYLVAFIDLLGQRQELMKLTSLPHTQDQSTQDQVLSILKKTAGRVQIIRDSFKTFFESAKSASVHGGDEFRPEQLEHYEGLKSSLTFRLNGFSDTTVIAVPLIEHEQYGRAAPALSVYSALHGIAGLTLTALSQGIPLRAGIDIERGTDGFPNEVYGPVTVTAII